MGTFPYFRVWVTAETLGFATVRRTVMPAAEFRSPIPREKGFGLRIN